jgi:hypothetical protein
MNRYPKFGASVLSSDRYVIVEVGLTPEERASLDETQKEESHPFIKKYLPRTEEIREEAERVKSEKRAREGIYIDNGIFLHGRKKTRSEWRDR